MTLLGLRISGRFLVGCNLFFFELVILGHLATRCHGQGTNQVALLLCEVTSIL